MIYTQHILYIGYGALALSAILLGAWYLLRQKVMREAHSEYQDRARELPHTIKNVDEETFIALYVGCHSPRWLKYMAGILATAVVVSPIVLLVVPAIYHEIWKATGEHDWAGRDGYVFMFSLFFAIAGVWAALGAVFARFHHARAPEPWVHAFARARGEPIPEEHNWRRRPKWAQRARAMVREQDQAKSAASTPSE